MSRLDLTLFIILESSTRVRTGNRSSWEFSNLRMVGNSTETLSPAKRGSVKAGAVKIKTSCELDEDEEEAKKEREVTQVRRPLGSVPGHCSGLKLQFCTRSSLQPERQKTRRALERK